MFSWEKKLVKNKVKDKKAKPNIYGSIVCANSLAKECAHILAS